MIQGIIIVCFPAESQNSRRLEVVDDDGDSWRLVRWLRSTEIVNAARRPETMPLTAHGHLLASFAIGPQWELRGRFGAHRPAVSSSFACPPRWRRPPARK